MDNKGFTLIETLVGLFLLGLIVITCLPIMNSGLYNINLAKEKALMVLEVESIVEKIKAYDCMESDEYIFDMKLDDLVETLSDSAEITINLPLKDNSNFKYSCKIHKKNRGEELWELHVYLSHNQNTRISRVDIMAIISIPRRDGV